MNNIEVLAAHPSVQDLDIACNKVNKQKVLHHTQQINAVPVFTGYHTSGPTATLQASVKAMRHESNIERAKPVSVLHLKPAAKVAKQKPPTPPAEKEPPQQKRAPSQPLADKRSQRSTASTVFSFEATDAESCSMYSCSCCHVAPPSSVLTTTSIARSFAKRMTNLAPSEVEDDNFSSISQRIARLDRERRAKRRGQRDGDSASTITQTTTTTVCTTKLRDLEAQLRREKEDRERTQQELVKIKEQQALLLSKLTEREKNELSGLLDK